VTACAVLSDISRTSASLLFCAVVHQRQFLRSVPELLSLARDDLPGVVRVCVALMDKRYTLIYLDICAIRASDT
jgi:hypothetical protein